MKKCLCIVLCFAIFFSLAACTGSQRTGGEKISRSETKSLEDTVKITVPLESIDEQYRDDLGAYCEKYGYESARLNKQKGTVTLVMNKFSHELLTSKVGIDVIKSIYNLEDNKDYPYVNKIESYDDENFSKVVISVDGKTYEKDALAPFVIAQSCLLYQFYAAAEECRCEIEVIDKDTKQVIETKVYTDKDE